MSHQNNRGRCASDFASLFKCFASTTQLICCLCCQWWDQICSNNQRSRRVRSQFDWQAIHRIYIYRLRSSSPFWKRQRKNVKQARCLVDIFGYKRRSIEEKASSLIDNCHAFCTLCKKPHVREMRPTGRSEKNMSRRSCTGR